MEDKIMLLTRFSTQYPSMIYRFFDGDLFDWSHHNHSFTNDSLPSVNVRENANDFDVEVAAPGMKKEDFKIELDQNILTISYENEKNDEKNDDQNFYLREFSKQSFKRSFTLPDVTDNEKIGAKYENGILIVNIPKKEEAKPVPARQIAIS